MLSHRRIAALVALVAAANANDDSSSSSNGGRNLRNPGRHHRRAQMKELGGSLCKSIIAVGGMRRRHNTPSDPTNVRGHGADRRLITPFGPNGEGETEEDLTFSLEDEYVFPDDPQTTAVTDNGGSLLASLPGVEHMNDPTEDPDAIVLFDDDFGQEETDEEFVCELHTGATLPISGTIEQIQELRTLLNSGVLVSAESSVEADEIDSSGGCAENGIVGVDCLGDGSDVEEFVTLPAGGVRLLNGYEGGDDDIDDIDASMEENDYPDVDGDIVYRRNRRLSQEMYHGPKKTLLVRATDADELSVPDDADIISDKFFGTHGDEVTTASGFNDCSFGKMRMTHEYEGAIDEELLAAPGVLEVDIPVRLRTSTQKALRRHLIKAAENKLGLTLPGPFDHVVFLIEGCYEVGDTVCAWSAYAFVNHWFSLFVEENYSYPAVVIHELGHNLNLAHSGGLDGRTYTDHTCLMGNPLWEDDIGRMCFNPVKNYQMAHSGGWYSKRHAARFDSGRDGGTSWRGRLVGVGEYDKNPNDHPIVLKIETGRGSDWFLGFNRAAGPNSDNVQFSDLVTVYKVANGNGRKYSHSFLKASLTEGQHATIGKFRNTSHDLRILVKEINTAVVPGYADVEVTFGDQPTPEPTTMPTTRMPSKSPTGNPVVATENPTTASTRSPSGKPTQSPSAMPTMAPSASPSAAPTREPTMAPSNFPSASPSATPTGVPTNDPTTIPWRGAGTQNVGQNLCKSIIAVDGWRINTPKVATSAQRQLQNSSHAGDDHLVASIMRDPDPHAGFDFIDGDMDFVGDGNISDIIIPYGDEDNADPETEEEFVCELQDGSTLPIQGTQVQMVELRALLNNGTLVSAHSSVEADQIGSGSGGDGGDAIASFPGGDDGTNQEFVALPPGSIKIINSDNESQRRRLANLYVGDKKVLIVKVIAQDGEAVPESAAVISNKFFGTTGDPVNMKSGFNDCSFGKFRVTNDYGGAVDETKLAAPGVIEVKVPIKLWQSTQETLRYEAVVAVQKKLQMYLPGIFDHVVFVVPKCYKVGTSCSFAAYAFVNHWLSLFVEDNWKFSAVQMHEIGHNLNLAHSGGLNGRTYTDHTCLMGNPLWQDNVGRMCFNPVKEFQIIKSGGWYDAKHIQTFNPGTTGGTSWTGRIIDVETYNNNPSNHPLVVKIEHGNEADWFIGFNHARGRNAHTQQAKNAVTVYKVTSGDGLHYSNSQLKAVIRNNQRGTIRNWRKSGLNLVIRVNNINTAAGFADVAIRLNGPPPTPNSTMPPTTPPTSAPTSNPTLLPTSSPTKDALGGSNSTGIPTVSPTGSPTNKPTPMPTNQCGNGICNGNESSGSCPADCTARTFATQSSIYGNRVGSTGQLFTVKAKKQVKIKALQIIGKSNAKSRCRVFTRRGGYRGQIRSQGAWTKLLDKTVTMKKGKKLSLGAMKQITLAPGTVQSFYIHCSKGMLNKRTSGKEGSVFRNNASLEVRTGVATRGYFGPTTRRVRLIGWILYDDSRN